MKAFYRSLACIILFLIMPLSTASSFEGPLQVNNLYPIFLHADQQYLDKAAAENSMSYSLSHSSTYTVQSSGEWDIDLDMEVTELNFRYKRIIKDVIEFDMDLPVLIIGGGFMDDFLESYHSTFGLPDYGRSERPNNEYLYEVRRDGALIIDGKSGISLGDIRLALKKPLITSDGFVLSIKGDIELPVGNSRKGYGNGSLDIVYFESMVMQLWFTRNDGHGNMSAVAMIGGGAQGIAAGGRGIIRQALEIGGEGFLDEGRRLVLRLADGQPDFAQRRGRLDAPEELAQLFERVGVELVEVGIHVLSAAMNCLPLVLGKNGL